MSETSEQRNRRFRELKERIADSLLEKYPEVTFIRNEYSIKFVYYEVYFSEERIKIYKRDKEINSLLDLDCFYLTEEKAVQAISEHIPAAKAKFENCLTALNQLKESMEFDVICDTHGIEDNPSISFELGGFEFTFEIGN